MDPATIAAGAMAVLRPLLSKGVEVFADEVGEIVGAKARSLWDSLKARWAGAAVREDMLTRFEAKPDVYGAAVHDLLVEALGQDEDLAKDLARVLAEIKKAGPDLRIAIDIQTAEDEVVGLEAQELNSGTVATTIEIDQARGKVTGNKIDRIG
jgi:hypothetical protein